MNYGIGKGLEDGCKNGCWRYSLFFVFDGRI